jgi:hypothetical protein
MLPSHTQTGVVQEELGSYGYQPSPYDDEELELLDRYRPGGLHPIIIGDALGPNGRYQVVRKLGGSGQATVSGCAATSKRTDGTLSKFLLPMRLASLARSRC